MDVDELIAEGERLKEVHYDDPDQHLWDNDIREFVKPFGDRTYQILEGIIAPSSVIWGDDDNQFARERIEDITKAQKLLESLRRRSAQRQAAQSETIAPTFAQAKQQLKEKITTNYNINAPTTFGDNSPISQITIGEFFAGLEQQIEEKVKDETEKNRLLAGIKSVTTDPSFVAIASVAATSIMKKLLGS
ncbi:MAG: hypothetical protein ACHQT9_03000 [Candidatus Saccharimonadales bacterium]